MKELARPNAPGLVTENRAARHEVKRLDGIGYVRAVG
jgi:hypothetical protein